MEMTVENGRPDAPKSKVGKVLLSLALGAVTGFLGATAFMKLTNGVEIGRSGEIAGLVGLVYLLTALVVIVGFASPSIGARFLNVEDAGELQEQRRMLGLSGASSAAIGGILMVLALARPSGILPEAVALAAVVVLGALATWLSILSRRHIDELLKTVSHETLSLTYYLLAVIGGGWAILGHLGFAAGPAPLDWVSMLAGLLLVATFVTCGRRGMLKPR